MRTLVDISDGQIDDLAAICIARKISRAEAVRQAIAAYINQHCAGTDDAFGIWNTAQEDGLAYQQRVRSER